MSFALPNFNTNKKKTQRQSAGSPPHSGGSSPVHITHLTTSDPTSRDTSHVTVRSISASHATSHAKAAKQSSPPRKTNTPIGGLKRTPPPGATIQDQTRRPFQVMGGLTRTPPQANVLSEPRAAIVLNSPTAIRPIRQTGFLERQEQEWGLAEESTDVTEEREVWALTSPQKEDSAPGTLGEKPAYGFQASVQAQSKQRELFTTTTRVQPSTIGTWFLPMRYEARPQPGEWSQLSNDIKELKSSSQDTSDAIRTLINEI